MDKFFTKIASKSANWLGHPLAFVIATLLTILWAVCGPVAHYSDTWQLVINTATTVLTFLAVFLIQNSQNRDSASMQAKLDEILRALDKARSEFVGIEHLSEPEICAIRTALEREVAGKKRDSTDDTVEQLLKRLG